MNKKYKYFVILFLIVFTFIAFGRIVGNDFINFDDEIYITKNQHVARKLVSNSHRALLLSTVHFLFLNKRSSEYKEVPGRKPAFNFILLNFW